MPPPDGGPDDDLLKLGVDHAWNWFSLHASQRMQTFNFFLIATAFLVAAYGAVIEKHTPLAVGVALLGAWLSLWFNRLERRSKQLVKAGEAALGPSQKRVADAVRIPELAIVERVEAKAPGSSSYSVVINVIEWTIFAAFIGAATYAAWRRVSPLDGV